MQFFQKTWNLALPQSGKLIAASLVIGFLSAFLGISLKSVTEYFEAILILKTTESWIYLLFFPVFSLSMIYLLRHYLFRRKENKGIKEVFESTASDKNLPSYKIPSHFVNGFLTVIFGGSTGIEVSTVVASATIGSVAQQKESKLRPYKNELICAGVAAGVTALFGSPFAGILFAAEVIFRKVSKTFLLTNILAVSAAYALVFLLKEEPLFAMNLNVWHFHAIPYFGLLGVLAGLHSVYLTKCVLLIKNFFSKLARYRSKILIGSGVITLSLVLFPQLYGDGYHAVKEIIAGSQNLTLSLPIALTFCGILLLKPIVTSVTLACGGDGGVFAPSLFLGAFLGFFTALVLNSFLNANVIPINFMVIGMAAMLSASIHAPLTALFLVCGLVNDYTLFFPILAVCLISKYTAKLVYPYTVYTYQKAHA